MKSFIGLTVVALGGCVNHPVSCALGWYHEDCGPGTTAFEEHNLRAPSSDIHDDAKCRSDGLEAGTAQYTACRANFDADREARTRAALSALLRMQGEEPRFVPASETAP